MTNFIESLKSMPWWFWVIIAIMLIAFAIAVSFLKAACGYELDNRSDFRKKTP